MIYNINFDVAALIFLVAIIFIFYYKKWIPNLQNKVFAVLLWCSLGATITDILDAFLTSYPFFAPRWIHGIVLYLYFILIDILPVLYAFYIVSLTGIKGRLFKRYRGLLFWGPMIVILFIIITNPITNWLFYDNGMDGFYRNYTVIALLNTIAFYYLLYGIKEIYKNRTVLKRERSNALYSFVFFATVPVIIQMMYPTVFITMFGVVLCLLLIFMTIQSPNEIITRIGLLNNTAFKYMCSLYFDKSEEFVVMYIKIKNYKYYKKIFGANRMHDILQNIASKVENYQITGKETYYFYSGQFAVLMPKDSYHERLPFKMIDLFNNYKENKNMDISFTANVCIIECPTDANSVEEVQNIINVYSQKQFVDEITFAHQIEIVNVKRAEEIEHAIQRALNNNGFEVYYQPIYSVKNKECHSAEALIRLTDKELGSISPAEFIPISEKNGSIIQIGEFVFEEVCKFYKQFNLKEKGIQYIEINLSVTQCMQENLVDSLVNIMKRYDIDPNNINLEVTESVAAESPETLKEMMHHLANMGIQFSLDDYGTGFSNMVSLIDLPFSLVKIDRSVVEKIEIEKTQIALKNTIKMLRQMNILKKVGCDYLQGYYFSKAIQNHAFLSYIQECN